MNNLHPKLNWEAFQKARARRKRRKWLLWFCFLIGTAVLAGYVSWHMRTPTARLTETRVEESLVRSGQIEKPAKSVESLTQSGDLNQITRKNRLSSINPGANPELKVASAPSSKVVGKGEFPESNPFLEATNISGQSQLFELVGEMEEENTSELQSDLTNKSIQSAEGFTKVASAELDSVGPIVAPMTTNEQLIAKNDTESSKNSFFSANPLWLSASWSPWHRAEFVLPSMAAGSELTYKPLSSFQINLRMELLRHNKLQLDFAPQYLEQRFYASLKTQFETRVYAPGSVVGYLQTIKDFEPVYADSVSGIRSIELLKMGVQRELLVPVTFGVTLIEGTKLQLLANATVGLNYRIQYRGRWFDGEQVVELGTTNSQLGWLSAGGLALQYQQGRLRYRVSWLTSYRNTVRDDQIRYRNQVWVGFELPIW